MKTGNLAAPGVGAEPPPLPTVPKRAADLTPADRLAIEGEAFAVASLMTCTTRVQKGNVFGEWETDATTVRYHIGYRLIPGGEAVGILVKMRDEWVSVVAPVG